MFICCILSACSVEKREQIKGGADDYSIAEKKVNEEERYPEVLDELGIKHPLRLGKINIEDIGQKMIEMRFSSDYSQVLDGHYYYMRSDYLGNYIVYRDNKEVVTRFTVKDAHVSRFLKCGDLFYAFLSPESTDEEDTLYFPESTDEELYNLVCINQETGNVTILKDMSKDIPWIVSSSPVLYKSFLYYEDASALIPDSFSGRLAGLNLNEGLKKEYIPLSCGIEKVFPKPLITIIDGKIYYARQDGKKVTLYSLDLESNKDKEIFCYERKDEVKEDGIIVQIDNEYIYCQDFIIPREGGKMKKALKNRLEGAPLSYNDEYIFYIDKKNHLHRIKKGTFKDVLICKEMKVENVECVANKIYVRGYSKALELIDNPVIVDDTPDVIATYESSKNLFSMDINGENRKRLCREYIITEESDTP